MGPDQIHNILDYVIQPRTIFSSTGRRHDALRNRRQLWIRDCSKIQACPRTVSPEALSGTLANLLALLDHSTFRRFNEPDQHVHVLTAIRLRLQLFQGLCGVAIGGKKNLIRLLNLSNALL